MAGRGARYIRTMRKADKNQRAIVEALEAVGARVFDTSGVGGGCGDLIALKPNKRDLVMLEVKTDDGTLTKAQKTSHQDWPIVTVRTIQEALEAMQ
jgi:hypothetical protein